MNILNKLLNLILLCNLWKGLSFVPPDDGAAGPGRTGAGDAGDAGEGDMYDNDAGGRDSDAGGGDADGDKDGGSDGEDDEDLFKLDDEDEDGEEDGDDEGEEGEDGEAAGKKVGKGAGRVVKLDKASIAALQKATQAPKGDDHQQQQQLTPEQKEALTKPIKVSEDTLKGMGFENPTPDQVKAFQQFGEAAAGHAMAVAKLMIARERAQFEQALGPIFEHFEQQQIKSAREDFIAQYPVLRPYEKVWKQAASELMADPRIANMTQKQIYKEVARNTLATLTSLGIKVKKPNANHGADAPVNTDARALAGNGGVPRPNGRVMSGRSGGPSPRGQQNNPDADIYAGR